MQHVNDRKREEEKRWTQLGEGGMQTFGGSVDCQMGTKGVALSQALPGLLQDLPLGAGGR